MNWITRCPECATVYQVEPEQLQAAKGWLRCGQCQHVFDSTGLMLAWSATSTAPVDVSTPDRVAIEDLLKQEDRSMATPPSHAAVDLASFEEALSSFKPEIEKTIVELSNKPSGMSVAEDMPAPVDLQGTEGADPLPSRQLSKFWGWALLLGLLGQGLWIERHAVAVHWPAMDASFKTVCHAIACEAEFLQDVNAMVIDSSNFTQRDQAHELSWTVRNTSGQALAMTALELTLQDVQGKPVLRRVLLPAEVGAPSVLMSGQIWSGQLLMRVDPDISVTGYRILSFYP